MAFLFLIEAHRPYTKRAVRPRSPWKNQENFFMSRLMLPSAALVLAIASSLAADEPIKSGLEVGAAAGPFNVRDITGPNKGKTLCYR